MVRPHSPLSASEVTRKRCCLLRNDTSDLVLRGEPLLDGARVLGSVTGGSYDYTARQSIVYGYLPLAYTAVGTRVEIEWYATVAREPLYDMEHRKIKA